AKLRTDQNMTPRERSRLTMAAAAAGLVLCYWGVTASLVHAWTNHYLYSYGAVVPFISGYMVWARASQIRAAGCHPDYKLGVPLVLLGLAMVLGGQLAATESVAQVSLLVTLTGAVLLLGGRGVLAQTWFPILYLILGIPVWDRLIEGLQVPSQGVSARLATTMLRIGGIPASHDGTLIALPNLTLQVLRECSGVNQLISVTAMALPAAALWLKGYARRIVFIALAVTIAYLSNGFRIALVGFLGYHGWSSGEVSFAHLGEGLAVSLAGYVLIFACLSLLSREKRTPEPRETRVQTASPVQARRLAWLEAAVLIVLLSVGLFRVTFRSSSVGLVDELHALPSHIGAWSHDAESGVHPDSRGSGVDDELMRVYRGPSGERMHLYIGYHRYQTEGKELAAVGRREAYPVKLTVDAATIELGEIVHEQVGKQTGTLFWYDVNGRIVGDWYRAKGYMILDSLTRRRTNGAIVKVDWEAPAGPRFDASRQEAVAFVRELLSILPHYMPS
ncbi:MAG: exosortase C-terminal domain/associated protein EpsI, partial [Vicinamibacterales bacterium]